MAKNIIIVFLLVFIIFYAGQIAVYRSIEKLDSKKMGMPGMDGFDVNIMLGARYYDKYIPGLGIARIATGGPCRVEITYKGQTVSEPIAKKGDVDMDRIFLDVDRQYVYVTVQSINKKFKLERAPAK